MRPNVLFMMSDDHASNAISCYKSILSKVFKTPNLDRLSEEGMMLNNFYATNSICTPARATIMTGQYGHINGVRTLEDKWDPTSEMNIARLFKEAGYETSLFGKWHLHCTPEGFDEYKYLCGSGGQGTYQNPEFTEKGSGNVVREGYVTDVITDITLDYLKTRDNEKPFFMMCHHKAPHDFWDYPKRHEHLFDGVDIPVPESLFEDRSHRHEASREFGSSVTPRSKVRSLYEDFQAEDYVTGPMKVEDDWSFKERGVAAYQKYLKDYLRTVAGIDDSVGSILEYLESTGELDNTIIIYTSDQGMFLGEHDYQDKRWSFEESLKAPFLIRYPKLIKAGHVNEELVSNIDVAPTLLDLCDIDVPEAMQGESQKELLLNINVEGNEYIYFRYWMHLAHKHDNPAHFGIRTKEYKLIYYYGHPLDATGAQDPTTPQGFELYDMELDPLEMHNVFDKDIYEAKRTMMLESLLKVRDEVKDTDENFKDEVNFEKMCKEFM